MATRASRRSFLQHSAVAGAALGALPTVHAGGSDVLKIGLIGCGGRGTGAAENVIASGQPVVIWAMADVFEDRAAASREILKKQGEKFQVSDDRVFIGFDAYHQVLASDVDIVILATPPGFRPMMIKAAVEAGKNIFTEKPVGVDGAGIRTVLAAAAEAKKKGLAIAAGTQRRHQTGYKATIEQLHDGKIGDIVSARCYWNQGALWMKPREESWSDVEWQIRNWLYFAWLSGDHIVEQHVHNLDVINWVMRGHPTKAVGMGGRQVRTEPSYGHIFDHFAIEYEYAGGAHLMSMCRQIPGCVNNVSESVVGTKGTCDVNRYVINSKDEGWRFRGKDNLPYVQEHTDLIESIRAGKPINELETVAHSTLTAIMGRMAAYTGKEVTWEAALNSKESLVPAKLEWGKLAVPPVAVPGQTPLV